MIYLKQLFGETAVLFKDKINYKQPGEGIAAPHQDMQSNWSDFADFYFSQVCIDENTIENGCLQVCSGYNKNGLIKALGTSNKELMKNMEFIDLL